jgi:zinc protease
VFRSRVLIVVAFLLLLNRPAPAGGRQDAFRFPYPVKVVDLENGMRLVMVPMPTPGVVTYETVVRAGSRNELESGRTGYAHFFEHMMFRGTERYPEDRYGRILAVMGADGNASTSLDQTAYYATLPLSGLSKVIEMEADRFQNLRYTQEQFRKEAGAILGEFSIGRADPGTTMEETRAALAYRKHPYGHTTMGLEQDVRSMPDGYDYSIQFHDRYYRPEYCTVLVAGDFDTLHVERAVRAAYAAWPRGNYIPPMPEEPPLTESVRRDLTWNQPTRPVLEVSFRTPGFSDTDPSSAALATVGEIYFGQTSDLYRSLVERQGLAESIGASFELTRDPYLFTITARLKKPGDSEAVRDSIVAVLLRAARTPVAEDHLDAAKRHMAARLSLRLEAPGSVGHILSEFISLTGDPGSIERYSQRVIELKPSELQEAASRWLNPARCITLTMKGEEGRP